MTLVTVYKKHEHAEPEFIDRLADLSGLKHLNVPWPIYLHAQLYYVRADNSYFAILGLANIASDRLWKNEELSSKFMGLSMTSSIKQIEVYLQKLSALKSACSEY